MAINERLHAFEVQMVNFIQSFLYPTKKAFKGVGGGGEEKQTHYRVQLLF